MFTFIRIMAFNALGIENHRTPNGECSEISEHDDQDSQSNPWQQELDRLAHNNSHPNRRRLRGVYQAKQIPKAGTITDLKVWWGKATSTYRAPNVDVSNFSPPPVKKRNHWYK